MSRDLLINITGKIISIVFRNIIALTSILVMLFLFAFGSALTLDGDMSSIEQKGEEMTGKVIKSDEEWRQILTPEQFEVTRMKGTERAFTGKNYDFHEVRIAI